MYVFVSVCMYVCMSNLGMQIMYIQHARTIVFPVEVCAASYNPFVGMYTDAAHEVY